MSININITVSNELKDAANNCWMYSANGAAWTRTMCGILADEHGFGMTEVNTWFSTFLKAKLNADDLTKKYLNDDQFNAYGAIRKRVQRFFEARTPKAPKTVPAPQQSAPVPNPPATLPKPETTQEIDVATWEALGLKMAEADPAWAKAYAMKLLAF